MSFWSHSPGPFWSHWFSSLFLCKDQETGVLDTFVSKKPRLLKLPPGTRLVELTEYHAIDIQSLLSQHYQTFTRSKIVLTASRIRKGFLFDNWIGVGVFAGTSLIGCVISRDIGTIRVRGDDMPRVGYIDFFCVAELWRKKGIASLLLQEIVIVCANKKRFMQVFQKEGLPLSPLPPIWQSSYIWRKKGIRADATEHIEKEDIWTHSPVHSFNYTSSIPFDSLGSKPSQLSGDSELYCFNYRGYTVHLCITDTFHRSVPEGWKIGEIQWCLPKDSVPLEIQQLAVEALVDTCKYEMVLMDKTIPHQKEKGWERDSPYGIYVFNYNPGHFFSLKPYLVF